MNFLAHAYLSFNHAEVMVGNMISDFVKGKTRYTFLPAIQNGIELHRRIDCFTDTHAATKKAQEVFRPRYRLYSGPFTDIVYDHFLANDVTIFSNASLYQFSQQVYDTLDRFAAHLPPRFLYLLPYMKSENWLYNYSQKSSIRTSFNGLVRRSSFLTEADIAYHLFGEYYSFLQECYMAFLQMLKYMHNNSLNYSLHNRSFNTLVNNIFAPQSNKYEEADLHYCYCYITLYS